jgi:hypothetical protein
MPKCRFCDVDIPSATTVIVVYPPSAKPRAYCSLACTQEGEDVDRRLVIARDPHRERPPKYL